MTTALQKSKTKRRDEPGSKPPISLSTSPATAVSPAQPKKPKGKPPEPPHLRYPHPQRPRTVTATAISDEAEVTVVLNPSTLQGTKPPPLFVQNKDRWTKLRMKWFRCWLYAASRIGSSSLEELGLDLVLITGTSEAKEKEMKAACPNIKSVCSLSGIKVEQPRKRAQPGSATTIYLAVILHSIASIPHDALSTWENMTQHYTRAIRSQTDCLPVSYVEKKAIRPTI
ncbi:hypothetical protein EVAR_16447_1 [Eumeta japonica]|uniref:Uncharacterized protein n=1 Tax=Eumeta variegata TaxID=151549 RepID=A0A4C1UL99_EUMVA|nr:hypothetical protein EVAR_16447_1 [Eumeta japonica]